MNKARIALAASSTGGAAGLFSGPLFIVGMPRSGTKLVRALLNGSPRIGIPQEESHFIPYFATEMGLAPQLEDPGWRARFMGQFNTTPLVLAFARKGRRMPESALLEPPLPRTWADLFERILRFFAPPGRAPNFIWGDKTPGYLWHLPLLRELFPEARVLHIIRDPREYCLSVRNAWGKSMLRAADEWRMGIKQGRRNGASLRDDYCEVRYEELTADPEAVLRRVCSTLRLPFSPVMLRLSAPSENIGRAKGYAGVLANNTHKYMSEISPGKICRIEEVVYLLASELGYPIHYASGERGLSPPVRAAHRYYDGMVSWRFHIQDKGLVPGTWFFLHHHRYSRWGQTVDR